MTLDPFDDSNRDGSTPDDDDLELVALLRAAFDSSALAPVPAQLTDFADQAFEWAVLDEVLMQITADEDSLVATRAVDRGVSLEFESANLSLEVSIEGEAIIGIVTPVAVDRVELSTPSGTTVLAADARGRFRARTPAEPFRLVVDRCGVRHVTPWYSG